VDHCVCAVGAGLEGGHVELNVLAGCEIGVVEISANRAAALGRVDEAWCPCRRRLRRRREVIGSSWSVARVDMGLGAGGAAAEEVGLWSWGDGDGDDPGLSARTVGGKVAVEEGLGAGRCERAVAVGQDDKFVARADVLARECAADLTIEKGLLELRDRIEGGDGAGDDGVERVLARHAGQDAARGSIAQERAGGAAEAVVEGPEVHGFRLSVGGGGDVA
jgi:hypothetical protein